MKICILQYEDRINLDYFINLQIINKNYCKKHNCDYVFRNSYSEQISPYWIKVFLIKELLDKYDYILYIDSDAVVNNFNMTIPDLFKQNKYMIYTSQVDAIQTPFNAGVLLFKKSDISLKILDIWVKLYDKSKWHYNKNEWKCDGKWSGEYYEQGAFLKIINDSDYNRYLQKEDYIFLNSTKADNIGFTKHFYYIHKKNIPEYLRLEHVQRNLQHVSIIDLSKYKDGYFK